MITFRDNNVTNCAHHHSILSDIVFTSLESSVTQLVSLVQQFSIQLVLLTLLCCCYVTKNCSQKSNVRFPQVNWVKNTPLIFNGWCTMTTLGKVGMKLFTDLTAKHGRTFNLPFGPLNVIATSDPAIIQKLLSSNTPTHITKSSYIYKRLFVQELHDGLFVSKPHVWVHHRKTLSRGFLYSRIISYMPMMNHHSEQLKNDILSCAHKKSFSDGDLFATHLGMNLLKFTCELITGPGSYTTNDILQIHQSIETHKECLLHVFKHPYLFLRPLWRIHPKKRISDAATKTMVNAMRNIVRSHTTRQKQDATKPDTTESQEKPIPLMNLMLQEHWSEKEILDNFASFVFAEHEANFAAIQFTLLHLANNITHQNKCREEIDSVFNTHGVLNTSTLTKLKHVERCINESLRLTPPVPVFARRVGSPLHVNENLTIPLGRTIMIMPWVLHRDPVYYPNPEIFDPDRFVRRNGPDLVYTYIPFSAGRRNCIAWKLSLVHLKVMVAWILRYFYLTTNDKLESIKMFYAVRVVPERNVRICFTKRDGI